MRILPLNHPNTDYRIDSSSETAQDSGKRRQPEKNPKSEYPSGNSQTKPTTEKNVSASDGERQILDTKTIVELLEHRPQPGTVPRKDLWRSRKVTPLTVPPDKKRRI